MMSYTSRVLSIAAAFAVAGALAQLPGCNSGRTQSSGSSDKDDTPSAASNAKFTDITNEAGLNFRQYHGGCGQRYFVEQVAAGEIGRASCRERVYVLV